MYACVVPLRLIDRGGSLHTLLCVNTTILFVDKLQASQEVCVYIIGFPKTYETQVLFWSSGYGELCSLYSFLLLQGGKV